MRNNLLVTILILISSSLIFSQDLKIKKLHLESKNNGTVIKLESNKKVNLENVTAWYSSEWFYMTIYGAKTDSLSVMKYKNKSLKNVEVSNSKESTQIALQLFSEIESFEINTSKRKSLQFFLRNSQSSTKQIISSQELVENLEIEENIPKAENIIYEKEESKSSNNRIVVLVGFLVSAADITNSTSFAMGTLIAVISNFL